MSLKDSKKLMAGTTIEIKKDRFVNLEIIKYIKRIDNCVECGKPCSGFNL